MGAGLGLLWVAFMLRADEHGKFHLWLDGVWVSADDLKAKTLWRQAAITRGVAATAHTLFDYVFGARVSFHAITNAVALSVVSVILGFFVAGSFREIAIVWNYWVAGAVGLILIALATHGPGQLRWASTSIQWVLVGLAISWLIGPVHSFSDFVRLTGAISALAIGAICSLFFVRVLRFFLSWAAERQSMIAMLTVILGSALIACLLLIVPLEVIPNLPGVVEASEAGNQLGGVSVNVGLSNFLDVLLAVFVGALAALAVLNRLLWPLVSRCLYAIASARILSHRLYVGAVGCTLLAWGCPALHGLLAWALKPFPS